SRWFHDTGLALAAKFRCVTHRFWSCPNGVKDTSPMRPSDEKTNRRLTWEIWLFLGPIALSFVGLGVVFVGLIARHYESSRHWGIWCSIIGWGLVFAGLILRPMLNRWSKKFRD